MFLVQDTTFHAHKPTPAGGEPQLLGEMLHGGVTKRKCSAWFPQTTMPAIIRLDDLYRMVSHIYSEQNAQRAATATFAHFVEVCGMLTLHDRDKPREGLSVDDALCKALGWYFPLLAKFRVRSVEELIFRKFPYACPYCRRLPHKDEECKRVEGPTPRVVDHAAMREEYIRNLGRQPRGLDEWQSMFQAIYPRSLKDRDFSVSGLFEELGELAEAIRVFDRFPKYFAGEAADVFSYIMGIANEHRLRERAGKRDFSFEAEFIRRYPGLCVQCGNRVCVCPAVPEATVGRLSKELDLSPSDGLFQLEPEKFRQAGADVAADVLERLGGFAGLATRFPFDRGETNKALTLFMLRLADEVAAGDEHAAQQVRTAAMRMASAATYPGSRRKTLEATTLLDVLRPYLSPEHVAQLKGSPDELAARIGKCMSTRIRVLFVAAQPNGTNALRLQDEERAIRGALNLALNREAISLTVLPAATVDDLRRAMLQDEYEVVHFAGHGAITGPVFQDESSGVQQVPLPGLRAFFAQHPEVKCVVLNACWTLATLDQCLGPLTVGMESALGDRAAIEFTRGFYDALAAGRGFENAVHEGRVAVQMKGLDADLPLKVLQPE